MSPEERQLLAGLFDRIRGAAATPRDPEAEALISDAIRNMPYAPYLLAQAVIVQDQALQAANGKIQDLESRLAEAQQPPQATGTGGFLSGIGSIFGAGGPRPPQPAPQSSPWGQQQSYAPPPSGGPWGGQPGGGQPGGGQPWGGQPWGGQQNPGGFGGMMNPGGSGGFLKGALGAAAGVAGGVLLADSIRGLFGAHNNPLGIGTGFGPGIGGETVVNNFYDNAGGSAAAPESVDHTSGTMGSPQNDTYDASFDDSNTDFGSNDDGGTFDV
ncbi:MAG: DUF2076 domain-containing protein [Methylovirgula sp.]